VREEPAAEIIVSGIHCYAEKRISAGDELHLRVSAPRHDGYSVSVHRLGPGGYTGNQDVEVNWPVVHISSVPQPQPICPGSYVRVADGIRDQLGGFTIECWVRRHESDPAHWQGILSQYDYPSKCSYGLFLDPNGKVFFYLGDGGRFIRSQLHGSLQNLNPKEWTHLVGTWNGQEKILYVNGKAQSWSFKGKLSGNKEAIRMGSYAQNGVAGNFLDGDLAMPTLYNRALTKAEVKGRFRDRALSVTLESDTSVLAAWPLDEEQGTAIADSSQYGRHGNIINHATWMIGGPSFNQKVSLVDSYDPSCDRNRGHALRLASDDLIDCNWQVTDRCQIPVSADPGIYAARLSSLTGVFLYDVTFVLKRSNLAPRRALAVICSTNTWLAYNAPTFANSPPAVGGWDTGSRDIGVPGTPASSCYVMHSAGQPTYHCGLNLPWPMAQAHVQYTAGYSHLVGAELPMHAWLRSQGYDFDVLTDFDLHDDPTALQGRLALVLVGHSEYWSVKAQTNLEQFLESGGNAIVASGNTMFWRVDYDINMTAMECRKHAPTSTGAQVEDGDFGTAWHTSDKKIGGLLRNAGHPGAAIIGMESAGYGAPFVAYQVVNETHFLFQNPFPISLTGGLLGTSLPLPVGHEWDVRVSQLAPANVLTAGSANPPGLQVLASASSSGNLGASWDYSGNNVPIGTTPRTFCEIIFWQRVNGGQVFHTGSIGYAQALAHNLDLGALLKNVLFHFGVH
jgi:Concanavalin A-like lectin/glucanases superfamily